MTPTIRGIQIVVSARCGVTLKDLLSDRRDLATARPRQIAMWLARHTTPHTIPEIGRHFGRDHTTVAAAIAKVDQCSENDPEFRSIVLSLWRTCIGQDGRPQVPHSPHLPQTALEASESDDAGVGIKPPALGGGAIRSSVGVGSRSTSSTEADSLCQSQRVH